MTTPLGQLAQPYLCFPSRACGVQFFRDRPVCSERLRRVARREPGPPRVRQKLGAEERVQGGRGGHLVCRLLLEKKKQHETSAQSCKHPKKSCHVLSNVNNTV